MREIRIEEMAACAKREVGYRKRVYRRLIEKGAMAPERAEWEIAVMEAIAEHFERISQPEML